MKKIVIAFVCAASLACTATVRAQEEDLNLPRKVENIELTDLYGKPARMPMWGEKNLLIFYVDPDRPRQNHDFTVEMEENHRAAGDNIYGFGIVNLRDSWYPVSDDFIRKICRKRTEKNGATIICDADSSIRDKWDLGNCNNKFLIMIVTREGELVYCHKGEYTEEEKEEFYSIVNQYR